MAYVAAISVMQTIHRVLNFTRVSIVSSNLQIIRSAYIEAESLKQVLRGLDNCRSSSRRKRMSELDGDIREAVSKLDDVIDSSLSNRLLSQSEESIGDGNCPIALFSIHERLGFQTLIETVKRMKEEYAEELQKPEEEEEGNYAVSSRSIDFGGRKSSIFGLSDGTIRGLKLQLTKSRAYEFRFVSIVGEGGTTRTIFSNLVRGKALRSFGRYAMVKIGPKYQVKDILIGILSQIDQKLQICEEGDDDGLLGERVYACLKGRKYLIVLDDMCEIEVLNLLRSSFPKNYNGSRVFLTTGLMEVAEFADSLNANSFNIHRLYIIDHDESWDVIRELEPSSYPPHDAEKISKVQLILSEAYDEMSEISRNTEELQSRISSDWGGVDYAEIIINQMFALFESVDRIMFAHADEYWCYEQLEPICLFGMAGIGKTTIAREIFKDPSIMRRFDLHLWVTLGPNYQSENILADILAQIDPDIDKMHKVKLGNIAEDFWAKVSCQRCFIVLDDVWSQDSLHLLHKLFNYIKFDVLLTTTLKEVAGFAKSQVYEMQLLNKEKSWRFLHEIVFAEKFSCPPELEKAGKMIAEECEGLPLMIAAVASLLSEAEKTPEYWTQVAKKKNSVFEQAYENIWDWLYPTYEYLPQFLKAYFLYMGVFPQKYEIPTSKLLSLWSSEGIIEPEMWTTLEDLAKEYLTELVSRSLLLEMKTSSSFVTKTSRLHSVYWYLCTREARKIKFFHVLNRSSDGYEEYIKGQRRLCIQNNVLFGMKEVHNSMASNSTASSLLCTGPPHPYSVPICLGSGLLRVLDAHAIRFYEFPFEVLHLVLLRYFGLTYAGKLPPSISKLRNLECLIISQRLQIKLYSTTSYLPKEIWDMKELKHLQVMGSDLPDPCGAVLPNLVTLLDISAHSVMQGVLQGTPNLKKLGIRIELMPDAADPLLSFDHLNHLDALESLKCVVVNPEVITSRIVSPPPRIRSLPSTLKKLSLSGLGYPWAYMRTISELPCLKVLKLRCYAFRGPVWELCYEKFWKLEYLLIEDTDLEYLTTFDYRIRNLRCLSFRHCYKLKRFPVDICASTCKVDVVDCSIAAAISSQEGSHTIADVHFSWATKKEARGSRLLDDRHTLT